MCSSSLKVFTCPLTWNAFHDYCKFHMRQMAIHDVLAGKGWYDAFYYCVDDPNQGVSYTQQYQDVRQANRKAEMPRNGIVCHQPRHEAALQLRVEHSASRDEVAAAGHWNAVCRDQVYANMPAADTLAQLAGFNNAKDYMVFEALLDPAEIPYFHPMWASIFPGVEDTLAELVKVAPPPPLGGAPSFCACAGSVLPRKQSGMLIAHVDMLHLPYTTDWHDENGGCCSPDTNSAASLRRVCKWQIVAVAKVAKAPCLSSSVNGPCDELQPGSNIALIYTAIWAFVAAVFSCCFPSLLNILLIIRSCALIMPECVLTHCNNCCPFHTILLRHIW